MSKQAVWVKALKEIQAESEKPYPSIYFRINALIKEIESSIQDADEEWIERAFVAGRGKQSWESFKKEMDKIR